MPFKQRQIIGDGKKSLLRQPLGVEQAAAKPRGVAAHKVAGGRRRRRHRHTVLAKDVRGHALADRGLVQRVDEKRQIAVHVGVDEPGGDGPVGRVDPVGRIRGREPPDRGDAVALDAEVAVVPRVPGAVDDPPALNQNVVHVRLPRPVFDVTRSRYFIKNEAITLSGQHPCRRKRNTPATTHGRA